MADIAASSESDDIHAKASNGIGQLKYIFDKLPPIIKRFWILHLTVVIITPIPFVSAAVYAYAIHEGLPPFNVIDEFGDRIFVIGILSALLFLMTLSIMLIPAFIRRSYKSGNNEEIEEKIDIIGWLDLNGIAAYIYLIIVMYVSRNDIPGDEAIPLTLSVGIFFPLVLYFIIRSSSRGDGIKLEYWTIIYGNITSLLMVGAVYLVIIVSAVSGGKTLPDQIFNFINSTAGAKWAALFGSIFLYFAPMLMLFVVSIRATSFKKISINALAVTVFMICIWPGGLAFIKGSFVLLKKGGDASFEMWMSRARVCQFGELLVDQQQCPKSISDSDGEVKTNQLKLGLLTKENAYIRIKYYPDGTDGEPKYKLLIIPRDMFSSYMIGEKIK
jgi:hypothetical protein